MVHLEPKLMSVLVCLAEHAGEPVSKEQLLQRCWPDIFVGDGVLTRSVFELRRLFEDDAKDPRVIQTVAKRGYRLLAPVRPVSGTSDLTSHPAQVPESNSSVAGTTGRHKLWFRAVAFGCPLLLLGFVVAFNVGGLRDRLRPDSTPRIHSLAVLP